MLWDVQKGLYDRLSGFAGLTALLADGAAGIRDHVPPETAFPYVVIDSLSARPFGTQSYDAQEVVVTLDTYSHASGMKEARLIMSALRDALHHQDFSIGTGRLVLCAESAAESWLESDGVTRHGRQRFRLIAEPA